MRNMPPATLPVGLKFNPQTGQITGKYDKATLPPTTFILQVTDAAGKSDQQTYTINAPAEKAGAVPEPPTEVTATAGNGCITLTWKPSPSPGVTGYRILRSTAPAAQQESRVHLVADSPELQPWDYVIISREFINFDMKYVNSRVRGVPTS